MRSRSRVRNIGGQGMRGALVFAQLPMELSDRERITFLAATHKVDAFMPCRHDEENEAADERGNPAALGNFSEIRDEERDIDAWID